MTIAAEAGELNTGRTREGQFRGGVGREGRGKVIRRNRRAPGREEGAKKKAREGAEGRARGRGGQSRCLLSCSISELIAADATVRRDPEERKRDRGRESEDRGPDGEESGAEEDGGARTERREKGERVGEDGDRREGTEGKMRDALLKSQIQCHRLSRKTGAVGTS